MPAGSSCVTLTGLSSSALLRYGTLTIASSSPERFLRLDGQTVQTRPIKGTIARSADATEDRRRTEILLGAEKDRAENTMIVDLLRNDLSRLLRGAIPSRIDPYPTRSCSSYEFLAARN